MNKELRQRAADIEARIKNGLRFYTPGFPPDYTPHAAYEQSRRQSNNQHTADLDRRESNWNYATIKR